MKILVVEGNIGVGKSTVLPKLADKLGYTYLKEPVDEDPVFAELLKGFTDNPNSTEHRLKFQKYITNQRANMLKNIEDGNYLIERSLFSDIVFSQVNMLSMARPDAAYLSYYYDIVDALEDYPKMNGIIYLKTDPRKSYESMLSRGRDAEQGTPFEYIEELSLFHDSCLPQVCRQYKTPLVTVDWDNYGANVGGVDGLVNMLENSGVLA